MVNSYQEDKYLGKLASLISKYQAVSFDVFDTLLLRAVAEPCELFLLIGQEAQKKGLFMNISPYEFVKLRMEAEKLARRRKRLTIDQSFQDPEVSLGEIYDCFPEKVIRKDELMQLELSYEKRYCYINKHVADFIKYCKTIGKKVILVSDMYLNQNYLSEILDYNGFDVQKEVDGIFVSCDYQCSKESGKLFALVCERVGIAKQDLIHIGDSEIADLSGAKAAGVKSFKYGVITAEDVAINFEEYLDGHLLSEIKSLRRLTKAEYGDEKDKFWYEFGAGVLGPVLTLFVEWILKTAQKEGITHIYPLMREGVILSKLLQNSLAFHGSNRISVKPLYVSRESTFLPSKSVFNQELYFNYFLRKNFTVKNLFSSLDILPLLDKLAICPESQLHDLAPEMKEKLYIYLSQHKDLIDVKIQMKKDIFLDYLRQLSIFDHRFITCDIGFNGTIQENMTKVLRENGYGYNPLHLMIWGKETVLEKRMNNIEIRGFLGNLGENIDLISIISWEPGFIEELMMDETGTTIGYETINGDVKPVMAENLVPDEELEFKRVCQEGIMDFQSNYLQLVKEKGEDIEFADLLLKQREISQIITRVFLMPTKDEAQNLLFLHHDDNYGNGELSAFYHETEFMLLETLGPEVFLSKAKKYKVAWPQGIVTLKEPSYLLLSVLRKNKKVKANYLPEMIDLCDVLREDKVNEVIIYGAGEVGRSLVRALRLFNIAPVCFVDRKESLWGEVIDGVRVYPLQEVKDKIKCRTVVIASFEFAQEIEKTLQQFFTDTDIKIYKV